MNKKFRLLSIILLTILMIGVLSGCNNKEANSSSIETINNRGKIKIGVFSDKPPFGYVDENGENQGFDVYIAKGLAKELLGKEDGVEFILVEAASRVEYLESGKVDLILANFTVTEERKEKVDFANPYMKVSLGVVSKDDALITDVSQLSGKTLIVNKGTTAETYFTKNHPEITLLKFDQNTEAFNALKDGRGDALAHDNTLLFAWAIENEGFTTGIETLGDLDYIAPAVQKGNTELLNWVNDTLSKLGNESFISKAYDETLLPTYGDHVDKASVIIEGGKVE